MSILLTIIIFGILIFIHEFGHFLMAKKNGVKVTEFSIGMGPALFKFGKKETVYSLRLFPFGGYCQMLGYEDESEDENDKDRSFSSKSVWSRMSITLAGPIFNFLLAIVLTMIVMSFVGYDPARVTGVAEGSQAAEAGLKEGDIITSYNGATVDFGRDILLDETVNGLTDEKVDITYKRDGQKYDISITPQKIIPYTLGFVYTPSDTVTAKISTVVEDSPMDKAGVKEGDVIIAINGNAISSGAALNSYVSKNPFTKDEVTIKVDRDGEELEFKMAPKEGTEYYTLGYSYNTAREKTSALNVIKYSFVELRYQVATVYKSLGMLFSGKAGINDLAGPVGIAEIVDDTYQSAKQDGSLYVILNMINLTVLLSANLGVMNLLPIPGLDGGRWLFQIIEAIRRKPIAKEKEGVIQMVGMILVMILAVVVLFNDIRKLF